MQHNFFKWKAEKRTRPSQMKRPGFFMPPKPFPAKIRAEKNSCALKGKAPRHSAEPYFMVQQKIRFWPVKPKNTPVSSRITHFFKKK